MEQHDEWALQRARYITLETMAGLSDDPFVKLPAVTASHNRPDPPETGSDPALLHHRQGTIVSTAIDTEEGSKMVIARLCNDLAFSPNFR